MKQHLRLDIQSVLMLHSMRQLHDNFQYCSISIWMLSCRPVRNQEEQIVTGHAEKVSLYYLLSTVHTHACACCFGQMIFMCGPIIPFFFHSIRSIAFHMTFPYLREIWLKYKWCRHISYFTHWLNNCETYMHCIKFNLSSRSYRTLYIHCMWFRV